MAEMQVLGGRTEVVICRDRGRRGWEFRSVEEIVADLNEVLAEEIPSAKLAPFRCHRCGVGGSAPPHAWPRDRRSGWQHIAVYVTEQRGGDNAWRVNVDVAVLRGRELATERVAVATVFVDIELAWMLARRTAELLGAV